MLKPTPAELQQRLLDLAERIAALRIELRSLEAQREVLLRLLSDNSQEAI